MLDHHTTHLKGSSVDGIISLFLVVIGGLWATAGPGGGCDRNRRDARFLGSDQDTIGEGGDLGGTMRLGAYPAVLAEGSLVRSIYGTPTAVDRHRHRYEVNVNYRAQLEGAGLRFSGMSPDGLLPENVERVDHPWFVGVQAHPELTSKPFAPHPLFRSFIEAAVQHSRLV